MIGVFDSGSGGLTVLRAMRDRISNPDILYFGDIRNAPYGSKTQGELSDLTMGAVSLLHGRGARSIVSACNSTSASLAVSLFDILGMEPARLLEMVGPTVAFFRNAQERILVCATPATVSSRIYQNGFGMAGKPVDAIPIPDLAGAIEFGAPPEKIRALIADAFKGVSLENYDAILLACTHYPLALESFRKVLGERVILLDPSYVVAERVEREFWPREAGNGTTHFVISKDSEPFRALVARLFPKETYTIEVLE